MRPAAWWRSAMSSILRECATGWTIDGSGRPWSRRLFGRGYRGFRLLPETRQRDLAAALLKLRRRFLQLRVFIDELQHLPIVLRVIAQDALSHELLVVWIHEGEFHGLVDASGARG